MARLHVRGGGGVDKFVFAAGDSSAAAGQHDRITDFISGTDKIDISAATIGVTPPGGAKAWCLADDVDGLIVGDGVLNQWWGSTQTTDTPPWFYDIDDYKWWIKP